MPSEIHKNDKGTAFRVTIKDETGTAVDLSGGSAKYIIFEKPDRTIVSKDASFYTDGTDGVIQYVTESGFLDQPALWRLQGYVVESGGYWKTDIYEFRVHKNLE